MSKWVPIGKRPQATEQAARAADAWVAERELAKAVEPTKRLSVDIPEGLHRRVKVRCAQENVKIIDVVRELLEGRFPEG